MQRRGARITGPFQNKYGVRYIVYDGKGSRSSCSAKAEAEALAAAQVALAAILAIDEEEITVDVAIERYREYLEKVKKNKAKSWQETVRRMRVFFSAEAHGDRPLTWWTAPRAAARYESFAAGVSVDYHRNVLAEAKTFLSWCADKTRAWLKANPLAEVRGVGERKHGKDQLRPEEALLWRGKAVELAREGDDGALAALLLLDGGARPSEITTRQVRDLVQGARFVMVDAVAELDWSPKTKKSTRMLGPLPADLAELLLQQARAKLPTAYLFPARGGGVHDYGWIDDQVKRVCRLAGLPERCAYSMRGLRTTLDLLAGRSVREVADERGHEDVRTTLTSYAAPGAAAAAEQDRYLRLIKGGAR